MPSIQEYQPGFTAARHVPCWGQDEQKQMYQPMDHRQSLGPTEMLRPMEPTNVDNTPRQPLPARITGNESNQQRQQLPGLQELLRPSVRPGASSSFSSNWPSVNNNNNNRSGPPSSDDSQPTHDGRSSQPGPVHFALTPPSFHRLSINASSVDRFKQPVTTTHLGTSLGRPSLPAPPAPPLLPPSRTLSELPGLRAPEHLPPPLPQNVDHAVPYQPYTTPSFRDSFSDMSAERRYSMAAASRNTSDASNYSLQCVGQRHIPGEGMCYVFKDGSTCPTIIDGEPVNPLWGTTKAGKARKRLAQACLNCREKKIKCEPGENSCVQCEKAKRECHRPTAQTQADLATNAAAFIVANPPLGRAEWSSQSSSSAAMTDAQTQKRRRSAQVAQQDALNPPTSWGGDLSPQSPKRRRSDFSISSADEANERQRKDSKRVDLDDILASQPRIEARDSSSWKEDPYEVEPEGTMRFLELFFAQTAREVYLLFPRSAFTRWVRNCRDKCQRECMVLYALLALGSTFAGNEFSSFAKLCSTRANQAVSRIDGQFSLALVQARLLVAAYHHLNDNESLGWDLSGSAIRVISAMRLNTEEGCGENLDELTRCSYNFTPDQLRECRRRTFWTAFLVDRYHGFFGGLLCTIQSEDIRLRLPCFERTYEDGLPSDAPMFDNFEAFIRARSQVPPYQHSPAAYMIVIASLWADVTKLIYRAPHQLARVRGGPPNYAMLVDEVQQKLYEWRNVLPPHLKYNRQNLAEATMNGYAGSLVSMHAIFHISQLRAARNTYNNMIPPQAVARHVRTAHTHALQLLDMVCDMRTTKPQCSGKGQDPVNLLSPFFVYGIAAAIDTLSAGGLRADYGRTMEVLSGSVATLHDLGRFCASAKIQASQTSRRMTQIELCAAENFGAAARDMYDKGNGDWWKIAEQMEKSFPLQQDVSYGISTATYLAALGERETC